MSNLRNAFICNGLRSPIGSFGGSLSPLRADDLAARVIENLLKQTPHLDPLDIGDVILGCSNQAGEDNRNVARMAALLAGLPIEVPGETINRLCASGMAAATHASRMIACSEADVVIAGGVEHMTRSPWVMSKASSAFGRDQQLFDSSFGWRFINPAMKALYGTEAMGETAENLASTYSISREDQDRFAMHSQQKAFAANVSGRLAEEILPISLQDKKGTISIFDKDEFIKGQTNLDSLSKLKPAFRNPGTVTAGNSSGLNDGAAALLLASEEGIERNKLNPLSRIVSTGLSGVHPSVMGIGPVAASNLALKRAGLTMRDLDLIELNEAFAAQVLACTRSWGLDDHDERLNVNGGAIALGHPLGMSGSRLLLTASLELQKRNLRYALCTMCIGVGQGYAVILERA